MKSFGLIGSVLTLILFSKVSSANEVPPSENGNSVKVQFDLTIKRAEGLDIGFSDNQYYKGPGLPDSYNPSLVDATLIFEKFANDALMQTVHVRFEQPLVINLISSADEMRTLRLQNFSLALPTHRAAILQAYGHLKENLAVSFGDFRKEAATFLKATKNDDQRFILTDYRKLPALYKYSHLALTLTMQDFNGSVAWDLSSKFQRLVSPRGEIDQGYFHRSSDLAFKDVFPLEDPDVRKILESIQELRQRHTNAILDMPRYSIDPKSYMQSNFVDKIGAAIRDVPKRPPVKEGQITRDGRLIVRADGPRITVKDAKRRVTILSAPADDKAPVTMVADSSRYVVLGFGDDRVAAYMIGTNEFVGELDPRGESLKDLSFQGATLAIETENNRAVYHAATLKHLFDQTKSTASDSCSILLTRVKR